MNYFPIVLGLIAGSTVAIGSLSITGINKKKTMGYLGAFTGGILSYLALDTGSGAEEIVTDFLTSKNYINFVLGITITSIGLLGTWIALSLIEKNTRQNNIGIPLMIAGALGIHNIGEGFAIAASLLSGSLASAWAFTIGFAIHNATEGVAISSPAMIAKTKISSKTLTLLSLLAGLPTSLGASIFYLGINNPLFIALLNTIASASLVFVMIKVNINAASLLGGFNTRFWTSLFLGVGVTYSIESILTILSGNSF